MRQSILAAAISKSYDLQCRWSYVLIALCFSTQLCQRLAAAPPDQAYHRTPACVDGNCIPNRATNGFHATRWRPWPGGEPSQYKPVPPVGIELNPIQVPPRDKELDLPIRPSAPGDATTEPSPNDQPSGGVVLPPELRGLTPPKPVEETRPGSSSMPRGPMLPGLQPGLSPQPLLLGKKPEPLRLRTEDSPPLEIPAIEQPTLKIRPASNSQSGLMPEMVPWNDEDNKPITRQAMGIKGNQVQLTIRLDEPALPDANENQTTTIQVQHKTAPALSIQTSAIGMLPTEPKPIAHSKIDHLTQKSTWHSSAANAPAILPNIEAQPLPPMENMQSNSSSTGVVSPLRGVSRGNPLRP